MESRNDTAQERSKDRTRAASHAADLRLAREALQGCADAREALVPHLARIPALVAHHRARFRASLQGHDEADLVQDCMELVWRKLPEYEGRAALSTWIWRLCHLELRNGFRRLRRVGRMGTLPDHTEALMDAKDDPLRKSLGLDLEAALARLTELQRSIVQQRHFEGRTMNDIAEKLGLPLSQVKSQYYRAIRSLHDFLRSRQWEGEA